MKDDSPESPVIAVAPVGGVAGESLAALAPAIHGAFGGTVVLTSGMPLPAPALDPERRQHRAAVLLDELARFKRPEWERLLGVAEVDLYAPGLNFVFGEADATRGVAVFSLARLRSPSGVPDVGARFGRRAAVEAIHELGHTFGLGHCRDLRCVMWFSNTLAETDRKGPTLCRRHARELEQARGTSRSVATRA